MSDAGDLGPTLPSPDGGPGSGSRRVDSDTTAPHPGAEAPTIDAESEGRGGAPTTPTSANLDPGALALPIDHPGTQSWSAGPAATPPGSPPDTPGAPPRGLRVRDFGDYELLD